MSNTPDSPEDAPVEVDATTYAPDTVEMCNERGEPLTASEVLTRVACGVSDPDDWTMRHWRNRLYRPRFRSSAMRTVTYGRYVVVVD